MLQISSSRAIARHLNQDKEAEEDINLNVSGQREMRNLVAVMARWRSAHNEMKKKQPASGWETMGKFCFTTFYK